MPKHHIPNLLTLLRILLVPALIAVYLTAQHTYLPFVLFTLIAMTDYLDGYLARRWSVQSALGAFLDPAADKILVCSLLVLLVAEHSTWLFTLPAIVIIFRVCAGLENSHRSQVEPMCIECVSDICRPFSLKDSPLRVPFHIYLCF